jgi:hypothetical protein
LHVSISDGSNLNGMLCCNTLSLSYFGRAGGKGDWGSLGSASGSDGGGAAAPAPQEQDGGGGSSSGGAFARRASNIYKTD